MTCDSFTDAQGAPTGLTLQQNTTGTISCTVVTREFGTHPPHPQLSRVIRVAISGGDLPPGVTITPFQSPAYMSERNDQLEMEVAVSVDSTLAVGTYAFQVLVTTDIGTAQFNGLFNVAENTHRMHVLYLVPSDVPEFEGEAHVTAAAQAIERAIRHGQIWFKNELGNGKTFAIGLPAVRILRSQRDSTWFRFHPTPFQQDSSVYWHSNVKDDVESLIGRSILNQPNDIYLVWVDSEPLSNQFAGAAVGSYGLLTKRDIKTVMGEDSTQTIYRGVGGSLHELGHAFGLQHPPTIPLWSYELMGTGYQTYPNHPIAFLRDTPEKEVLNTGVRSAPFFKTTNGGTSRLFNCDTLTSY